MSTYMWVCMHIHYTCIHVYTCIYIHIICILCIYIYVICISYLSWISNNWGFTVTECIWMLSCGDPFGAQKTKRTQGFANCRLLTAEHTDFDCHWIGGYHYHDVLSAYVHHYIWEEIATIHFNVYSIHCILCKLPWVLRVWQCTSQTGRASASTPLWSGMESCYEKWDVDETSTELAILSSLCSLFPYFLMGIWWNMHGDGSELLQ